MLPCTITVQKLRIPSLKGCRGKTLPQAKASPTGHFYHNKFEGTSQDDGLYRNRSMDNGLAPRLGPRGQGESLRQCQIKSEKKYKNSYTVRKLSHVFDCQWEGEPMAEQRANLVLIVGKSYWEKLVLP